MQNASAHQIPSLPKYWDFQNQGLSVWPQKLVKRLKQTWQPGAKYIYQKHHHKQDSVGGKEGPVGQHPRKTVAHKTGLSSDEH